MTTTNKTASRKRSSQSTKEEKPPIRILRAGKCKSLSRRSTISYQIGFNEEKAPFIRLVGNDGGGHISHDWVAVEDIFLQLESCSEKITSTALSVLFRAKSANNPGFLLAVLMEEGLLNPSSVHKRCYTLQDTKPFLEDLAVTIEEHSQGKKRRARRTKSKAPQSRSASPTKKAGVKTVESVATDET